MLHKIFGHCGRYSLLPLRLAMGAIFIGHGAGKLFGIWGGPGLQGFAGSLGALGLHPPMVMAVLAALAEFLGGITILIGFFARWGAVAIIIVMAVAVYSVHWKNGFIGQGGYEYNVAVIAMALTILFGGSGPHSVKGD